MHAVGPIFKRGKERRRGKGKRKRREERGEVVGCTKGRIEKRERGRKRKEEEERGDGTKGRKQRRESEGKRMTGKILSPNQSHREKSLF